MPYEASMCGGGPWGFRMGGGAFTGKPITISRITPGGKAAQSNVMQGDVIVAVNGMNIRDLQLTEVMQLIKDSGPEVHLTLLTQEEASIDFARKRQSEVNITTAAERERPLNPSSPLPPRFHPATAKPSTPIVNHAPPSSLASDNRQAPVVSTVVITPSQSPVPPNIMTATKVITPAQSPVPPKSPVPLKSAVAAPPNPSVVNPPSYSNAMAQSSVRVPVWSPPKAPVKKPQPPVPKPRTVSVSVAPHPPPKHQEPQQGSVGFMNGLEDDGNDDYVFPDYVKRQLKPQKPLPSFKPQVSWLHGKLKINMKGNAMTDPGNKLKAAAQSHPNQPISIEGPISGTVVHAQYNTPVGLYSGNQIVSTLVETAAARGANVPDPNAFGECNTNIDKSTPVYKMIHKSDRHYNSPAQSRSIQILDSILSHPKEARRYVEKH